MTIVAATTALRIESSAVPLARYSYITGYPECRFWGVSNADEPDEPCRQLLTKAERDMIAKYLAEAQDEIENVTGYRLAPTWEADEEQPYSVNVRTDWGLVIEPGVMATSAIESGAAVNHAADPAVVTVNTTVTDTDEIFVYHPGTEVEINPSVISIAGGVATISIPRCRMVREAVYAAGGEIDYTVTANFEQTVDVTRVYNDDSTQAEIVWTHSKNCSCGCVSGCCTCAEETETGCIGINNSRVGALSILRADYSAGSWTRVSLTCVCANPDKVRLNYRAGMTPLTSQAEDAIVRLAHSKMPTPPCGCDVLQDLWKRDRNQPDVLTRERLNCPFGLNEGAWISWRFANAMRLVRGGVL